MMPLMQTPEPPVAQEADDVLPESAVQTAPSPSESAVVVTPAPAATPPVRKTTTNGKNGAGANYPRRLTITFRRSGDVERDKFRLREIYDLVCDPRGRDSFYIRIVNNGRTAELAFPNDGCTINDRLLGELKKHFKLDVNVE
ncbi:MAG: hypothetical protein IPK16_11995 [Anaerolineales bacterium]|nr:hypothetical protein [Anaerolineales bacterium]